MKLECNIVLEISYVNQNFYYSNGVKIMDLEHSAAIKTSCGDWVFYHGSEAESIEDAHLGFCDGHPDELLVNDIRSFIAICLHLIQQTGGKLFYKDIQLTATDINQTSGNPNDLNIGVLFFNCERMTIAEILWLTRDSKE